jgi:hypothetical protein
VCIHGWILPGGHARYLGLVALEFKVDKFLISEFYVVMVWQQWATEDEQRNKKSVKLNLYILVMH